jgi:hypothetical protein
MIPYRPMIPRLFLVLLCFGIRNLDGMHEKLSEPMRGRKSFIALELIKRVILRRNSSVSDDIVNRLMKNTLLCLFPHDRTSSYHQTVLKNTPSS